VLIKSIRPILICQPFINAIYSYIENLVIPRIAGSSMGQVRAGWLCLEFLSQKIQITSTKLQINLKFQYSMTKTFQDKALFGYSNFGHWKFV